MRPSFDGVHRLMSTLIFRPAQPDGTLRPHRGCGSSSELAPGRSDPLSSLSPISHKRSSVEDLLRSMPGRGPLTMTALRSARLQSSFEDRRRSLCGARAPVPLSRRVRSVAHLPCERSASRLRPRPSHRRSRTPIAACELSFKARRRSSRSVILRSEERGIELPHHGSRDPLSKTAAAPSAARRRRSPCDDPAAPRPGNTSLHVFFCSKTRRRAASTSRSVLVFRRSRSCSPHLDHSCEPSFDCSHT